MYLLGLSGVLEGALLVTVPLQSLKRTLILL